MRIIWLSDTAPAGLTTDAAHFEQHRQASMRFRIGIPARALAALGVESAFIGLDTPAVLAHLAPDRVDAVVFSKLSTPRGPTFDAFATAYLGTADHARARGLRVVVDLVDNVFATDRGEFFDQLVARADAVTTGTDALAEVCRGRTGLPVHVVADPVEGEQRPPRFDPPRFDPPRGSLLSRIGLGRGAARPLRLLWFGGQYRNFLDLAALFPGLAALATERPVELTVVMNLDERVTRELAALRGRAGPGLAGRFVEWSLAAVAQELEHCDLVLLPADLRDAMRAVASANRVARALWAGRAVIAHPLPSYLEFRDAAVLGEDLVDATRRAIARPREIIRRIESGQQLVAERYSRAAIARRWHIVLGTLAASAGE